MTSIKEAITRDGIHLKANFSGHSNIIHERVKNGAVVPKTQVVRIYVTMKFAKEVLKPEALIPSSIEIDGQTYETDVHALKPTALSTPPLNERTRPVSLGYSFGHYKITAGTAGALVYSNGQPLFLTNNHVAANQSSIQTTRADIGDAILQPGPYDGGQFNDLAAGDAVGSLYAFVPIDETGMNVVDCALVAPLTADNVNGVYGLPINSSITGFTTTYNVGDKYHYLGRTSGYKEVVISDPSASIAVGYESFTATFDDVVVWSPSALGGDSGSGMLDASNKLGMLVFAGDSTNNLGISCKVSNILAAFSKQGITLNWQAPPPPPPPPPFTPNTITFIKWSQTTFQTLPAVSVTLAVNYPLPLEFYMVYVVKNSINQPIEVEYGIVKGFSNGQQVTAQMEFIRTPYGIYTVDFFALSKNQEPISTKESLPLVYQA